MSSDSDIEMQSAPLKKKTNKMPQSPSEEILKKDKEPKKLTTKDMIHDALTVLNTRKGVSLYAIKKFVTEKYDVNPEKINYFIKKSIKTEVEKGSIVQTKGIGASGSFKLAPNKKTEKPVKMKKNKKPINKKTEKESKKEKSDKTKETIPKKNTDKKGGKITKNMAEAKSSKTINKTEKTKVPKTAKENGEKKMAKHNKTPAKKRAAMMKRKSIGSIIKPPKMKPKVR